MKRNTIKVITKDDPKFMINSGIYKVPRAGFHIASGCPPEYRDVIMTCMNTGWLMPVAYMAEKEFIWETLND
jgi:hypothetical protein